MYLTVKRKNSKLFILILLNKTKKYYLYKQRVSLCYVTNYATTFYKKPNECKINILHTAN